jgi:hypothetical protein
VEIITFFSKSGLKSAQKNSFAAVQNIHLICTVSGKSPKNKIFTFIYASKTGGVITKANS